jgi:flagellar export protein FliJ
VLEWRTAAADTAHGAFVRAGESVREAATLVAAADAGRDDAVRALREELDSLTNAEVVARHRTWIDHQHAAATACQRLHDERVTAAAAAAGALADARRQVRVLERLRERALRRHTAAERRQEMQRLDEFALQQFVRSRMNGETEYGR